MTETQLPLFRLARTRRSVIGVGTSAVAVAMAACGGEIVTSGGATSKVEPTKAPVAPSPTVAVAMPTSAPMPARAAPPVKLLYWTQRQPADRLGNGVRAALDDYVEKNPGKVIIETGEGGQPLALDKIKTAIAAGTPPDLYGGLFQTPAAELFTLNAVVDLTAELKGNKSWEQVKGELLPSNLEGCSWKGKLVMMPMMLAQQVLGINKQLLLKNGVPLPVEGFSWSDFLDLGKKTVVSGERWLYPMLYSWSDFNSWIYANGLAPVSRDGTKVLYDTPQMLETLQWLHDQASVTQLFRAGPAANADFDTGKFVGWSANEAAGIAPVRFPNVDSGDGNGLHITHFPIGPSNTRKQIITYANVYGLIAMKTTDAKRISLAAEVTGWGGRSDVQMKIASASGHVPPNTVASQPEKLPAKIRDNPILKQIALYGRYSYLTPNYPSWGASMNILQENFMRIMNGQLRPRDALADAQPRIQEAVDADLRKG